MVLQSNYHLLAKPDHRYLHWHGVELDYLEHIWLLQLLLLMGLAVVVAVLVVVHEDPWRHHWMMKTLVFGVVVDY